MSVYFLIFVHSKMANFLIIYPEKCDSTEDFPYKFPSILQLVS